MYTISPGSTSLSDSKEKGQTSVYSSSRAATSPQMNDEDRVSNKDSTSSKIHSGQESPSESESIVDQTMIETEKRDVLPFKEDTSHYHPADKMERQKTLSSLKSPPKNSLPKMETEKSKSVPTADEKIDSQSLSRASENEPSGSFVKSGSQKVPSESRSAESGQYMNSGENDAAFDDDDADEPYETVSETDEFGVPYSSKGQTETTSQEPSKSTINSKSQPESSTSSYYTYTGMLKNYRWKNYLQKSVWYNQGCSKNSIFILEKPQYEKFRSFSLYKLN